MTESPEERVRELVHEVCAAHTSRDLTALETILASDATIVLGLGQVMNRTDYIAALEHFDTHIMKPVSLRVDVIGSDQVAICTGIFEYLARRIPQQEAYERVDIFHTMVWSREPIDWRLTVMHATRVPLQPPVETQIPNI